MTASLYIVTYDGLFNGRRRTGCYELDLDRMTKSNIVSDIINGQFEDVDKVYEAIPGESCNDVTEEIANLVADRAYADQEAISWELMGWLQTIRGIRKTEGLRVAP